jgi:hypothetical protein
MPFFVLGCDVGQLFQAPSAVARADVMESLLDTDVKGSAVACQSSQAPTPAMPSAATS